MHRGDRARSLEISSCCQSSGAWSTSGRPMAIAASPLFSTASGAKTARAGEPQARDEDHAGEQPRADAAYGTAPGRTHDGVVVAMRSNVRWCSDHLELHCRNGDIVRVLFVIDACDREIIAWSASLMARLGRDGPDLMVEAVEWRFGQAKTPHPVEWLSDNGSAYIARKPRRSPWRSAFALPSPRCGRRKATEWLRPSSKR